MKAILKTPQKRTAQMKKVIIKQYPELENLEVTPSAEEQIFKSEKYGFNEVTVKKVEGEELVVIPSKEEQIKEGLFNKITVNAIESEELTITPSTEEQVKEGLFNKVVVEGDNNLVAENIREGTSIFGVNGVMEPRGEENTILNDEVLRTPNDFGNFVSNALEAIQYINGKLNVNGRHDYKRMFSGLAGLLEAPELENNTPVINTEYMFNSCYNLRKGVVMETKNVTNFKYMYYYCQQLQELPIYNCDSVSDLTYCFEMCGNLTTIGGFKNLGKGYSRLIAENHGSGVLDLRKPANLTVQSVINILNNLYDLNLTYNVSGGGTLYRQRVRLHNTVLANVQATEEGQQAIANANTKGWNITT